MIEMEIKTRSGICVSVRNSTDHSSHAGRLIVFFDKPVQTIELTRKEAILLGSYLLKDGRTEVAAETRKVQVP
jgi:hypothetical protein